MCAYRPRFAAQKRSDGLFEDVAIRFDIFPLFLESQRFEGRVPPSLGFIAITPKREDLSGQDPFDAVKAGLRFMLPNFEETGCHSSQVESSPELGYGQNPGRH